MTSREPDIQFRDNIFLNRASLSKQPRDSHPSIPHLKISRSTWTKKVRKYEQSQQKGGVGNRSFEGCFAQVPPLKNMEKTQGKQTRRPLMTDLNRERRQMHLKQSSIKIQTPSKSTFPCHFSPNRNVYNQTLHEDLGKSGILIEKLENQYPTTLTCNARSKDSRQFLKSLKLKNNLTLFKGNFSKFTRKDIIHCMKNKRFNLTSDFEGRGWQHERSRLLV